MSTEQEASYRQAALRALEQFPVATQSLELVSISENVSFRVVGTDGDFALRLHRPGYNTLAELESERSWVDALAEAGVRVQHSLRTHSGGHFCSVEIPELQETRQVGMTRWLAGEPLGNRLEPPAERNLRAARFRLIGRLAADLHNQSSGWQMPAGFTRPRLDSDGLLGDAPRWGRFWEHPALALRDREQLLATRNLLQQRLADFGITAENFGLIHADLHAENILLSDGELGLIDFDDAAFGWHLYDLATALVEYWGDEDYPQLCAALLGGYRERRYLGAGDEAMLETFVLLRGMAIIGWFHQRPEHAQSTYFAGNLQRVLRACSRVLADADRG